MTLPASPAHRRRERRLAALLVLGLTLAITFAIHLVARAQPAGDTRASGQNQQHFLIVLKGTRPTLIEDITSEEQEIVSHHFALLQEADRQGKVALVGRCDDTPLGLIILHVASKEEAQEVLDNDPAVQAGLMRGELHPFTLYMGSLLSN